MLFLAHALVSLGGMAIFAYLAIHFDKWWIILFSFVILSIRYTTSRRDDDTKSEE